jgi:hypothetical protein
VIKPKVETPGNGEKNENKLPGTKKHESKIAPSELKSKR